MENIANNKPLFGAAYYLEYMPYDRLEQDMKMMKKAGMNTIRIAESTWSTLEPEEGKFDFSFIDRVLAAAKEYEMQVIVGTPTYAIPSWLAKKEPEVMVLTKEGRASYGRRQIMDIMHPVFREAAERVIRKLAAHTASHPSVIGFQIDNETKHYGTMSKQVQTLFVESLRKKYRTTEKLNAAFGLAYWSNAIATWEDFPDMKGCIHAGLASEFARFQRSLAAEYLMWQSGLVQLYKREDQFITHNFDFEWKKFGADIAQDGYSYGVQPDINHYEASKAVTIAGTDIYHPTQDELTGAEIAFGGDSIRNLKTRENYLVLECQAQAFKYWTPYPGQLRLHAYSHLASGAGGVMYWNWHSIHNGYETYWKGLLSHDLQENPVYDEACVIGKEWEKIGNRGILSRKKNDIALVVDNQSLEALKWFPIDKELSYNDVVRWMYDSLYELNLECDVVDVHALCPSDYKMIVTPALYSASEETTVALERFVDNGGVLVSSFRSFVADEKLTVYPDTLPHGLHACFGASYQQFTEPGKTKILGEEIRYMEELLVPESTRTESIYYQHKYWNSYAGITSHSYGKGRGYYIGCFVPKELLKQQLLSAVKAAGIDRGAFGFPLICRSGENSQGEKIHYLLNYSEEEFAPANPFGKLEDLLTGQEFAPGEVLPMGDWGVRVLVEK